MIVHFNQLLVVIYLYICLFGLLQLVKNGRELGSGENNSGRQTRA